MYSKFSEEESKAILFEVKLSNRIIKLGIIKLGAKGGDPLIEDLRTKDEWDGYNKALKDYKNNSIKETDEEIINKYFDPIN